MAMQLSVCRGRPLCLPSKRASTGGRPYRSTSLDNWRTAWPWGSPRSPCTVDCVLPEALVELHIFQRHKLCE
jgi:hypothetical protein